MSHIPAEYKTPLRWCLSVFGFALLAYLVYRLRDIITLMFIAFLFMTAISPLVNYFESKKISHTLSIIFSYIVVVILFGGLLGLVIPPFINQATVLLDTIKLPSAFTGDLSQYNLQNLTPLINQLVSLPKLLNTVTTTFSSFIFFITFGVIAFYLLQERPHLHHYLLGLMGHNVAENRAELFVNSLEKHIGGWVRGQLTVMAIFGILIFVGLALMRVEYALPLAILAALCEVIPNIGGILAAAPAIIIAYVTMSPAMAFAVTALYILIQEVEHNVIVPTVMKRVIDLNPLITILLILTGLELGGVGGALLAIPVYLVGYVTVTQWRKFIQSELGDE